MKEIIFFLISSFKNIFGSIQRLNLLEIFF